ncbi:hypothetical protein [Burkholderia glumae]
MNELDLLLKDTDCGELDLIHIAYDSLEEKNYGEFGILKTDMSVVWFEVFLDDKGILTFKHNNQTAFQADY